MCAKLTQVFDASKVDPAKAFDPLPVNWYPAVISESELKPGSKPKCSQLRFTYVIASGPFKGRKVWDGINFTHTKPETQAQGQQQFSAICHAIKVIKVPDTAVLHNKLLEIKVVVEDARWVKDGKEIEVPEGAKPPAGAKFYEAGNRVRGWREAGKLEAAAAPAAGASAPVPPAEEPAAVEPEPPEVPTSEVAPGADEGSAREPDSREFYAYLDGGNKEMTGDEIAQALADGMPEDTPIVLQGESDWQTAKDYGIEAPAAAEEEPAPPLPTPPPPVKKTPAAPVAKAAPAAATPAPAAGGKKTPPWLAGKK